MYSNLVLIHSLNKYAPFTLIKSQMLYNAMLFHALTVIFVRNSEKSGCNYNKNIYLITKLIHYHKSELILYLSLHFLFQNSKKV